MRDFFLPPPTTIMVNAAIADMFSLLSRLMEIHGENPFKVKSYGAAAFQIEQLNRPLEEIPRNQVASLQGIGPSTATKITEVLETGTMQVLEDLLAKTPTGVLDMMQVKGLGPKKIATIWKDMGIETVGELLYACQENRLMRYKGFGSRTQENVKAAIEFMLKYRDSCLFADAEPLAQEIIAFLQQHWPEALHAPSGAFRRQCPTLERIDFVTTTDLAKLTEAIQASDPTMIVWQEPHRLTLEKDGQIDLVFHGCQPENFGSTLLSTTGSEAFLAKWQQLYGVIPPRENEEELFEYAALTIVPPSRREPPYPGGIQKGSASIDEIQVSDIKGIIHAHSDWSDGVHSLEEMALACIRSGFEYLVISDHSRSAQYAGGLHIEKVSQQHTLIDTLNARLHPFRIFKGIESDILGDGSLDYPNEVLARFDLVIASIHSNLQMSEEKAMMRLMNAVRNPYTDIIGHPTGRLLLSRPGYPIDHLAFLDACSEAGVAVEINAHPRRLDLDWTLIPAALERNILLSIDPDAHSTEGFSDIRYGVLAAQKGGLTKTSNLSSLSQSELASWLQARRRKISF